MSSNPPTTIGKYQIIREIARSNDIVYEAWDPLMNRRVAVKEMAMPGGTTGQQREDRINRFRREARAAGSLQHPNIMTVFEVSEEGNRHYIAMEYLDGHTLRNEIDTKGFLPQDRALEIIRAVLAGLGYAHENGVIHRDIKPDNVQLLSDGRIKITDFGIARLTFEPNLTQDGQVFGTPSYMSPEQIVGRDIDARSDIFSVGVMFYEMLAGQKPFQGDSVVSITYAIMNKEPDRPQQANYAMWRVIEKAIDKSPALRFSNAQEMQDALDAAQRSVQPDGPLNMSPQLGGTLYQPGQSGALPPIVNPFAQQQAYNQQLPPIQQQGMMPVYNPYAQPGAGAVPPHTPAYGAPVYQPPDPSVLPGYSTPQAPIYYPPPPRQPLLSPETKFFVGRVLLAIMIGGTVVALVIGLVFIGSQVFGSCAMNHARATAPVVAGSLDEQIQISKQRYEKSANDIERDAAGRSLAQRFLEKAQQQLASGDEKSAEDSFRSALDYNRKLGAAFAGLAALYEKRAFADPNGAAVDSLASAAENWGYAVENELDLQRLQDYKLHAAQDFYQLASVQKDDVDGRQQRREYLYKALDYGRNTTMQKAIEAAVQQTRTN